MIYYYINLDHRPDRRAYMEEALAAVGLRHERIAAVDGTEPDVRDAAARLGNSRLNGRPISAGAYACFQSHRTAWSRLVQSGASHAAVLEDDMHLAPGISKLSTADWVPVDAGIVKLETFGVRAHLDRSGPRIVDGRRLLRLRSTHTGGGAYVLSAGVAKRLLAETETFVDAVDEVLFNDRLDLLDREVILQMWPAPAIQDKRTAPGAPSDVGGAQWGAGSIEERAAGGDPVVTEGPAGRVLRRLRAEIRALSNGTDYKVVPFG